MKVLSVKEFTVNSVEEFVKLKKKPLFHKYRQSGKTVGLAFLFARGAMSFALRDLEIAWTEDQADAFIADNHLKDQLNSMFEKKPELSLLQCKLVVCATQIRKEFFKTYPGLEERIHINRSFAKENGYIRSVYGAMRRLPQLLLSGKDDNKIHGDEMANLNNVATNTDIQNFESAAINRTILEVDSWIEDNDLKSRYVSQVHDAVYLYVHRSEITEVYNKVKEVMTKMHPEFWRIPLDIEEKICDPKLGGFYGSGISYEKYSKEHLK